MGKAVRRPWRTPCGMMMRSFVGWKGGSSRTTNKPSLAMEATRRYRFRSGWLVTFFEGGVPSRKRWCAWRRSGHSICVACHATLLVTGILETPCRISVIDRARTVLSSVVLTNSRAFNRVAASKIRWEIGLSGNMGYLSVEPAEAGKEGRYTCTGWKLIWQGTWATVRKVLKRVKTLDKVWCKMVQGWC